MCTEASWGSREKEQRLSVWFNVRVGEIGRFHWLDQYFQASTDFAMSLSKKGSCEFLFVFVIRRKVYFAFFCNSLCAAEQILPRFVCAKLRLFVFEEN